MTTYDFKTFVPRLIEQDDDLIQELTDLLKDAEDVEIRLRDDMNVVYILGLTMDENTPKGEIRRVKHVSYDFKALEGKFVLNATFASVLLSKQKETNWTIAEDKAYDDNLEF
jgi:hypothetical protein